MKSSRSPPENNGDTGPGTKRDGVRIEVSRTEGTIKTRGTCEKGGVVETRPVRVTSLTRTESTDQPIIGVGEIQKLVKELLRMTLVG